MSEENKKNKDYEFVLLERIEGKIDAIIEEQGIIKDDVKLLKEDMDTVKSDIVDIKSELKVIHKELENKTDKEVSSDYETRISSLENAVLASV